MWFDLLEKCNRGCFGFAQHDRFVVIWRRSKGQRGSHQRWSDAHGHQDVAVFVFGFRVFGAHLACGLAVFEFQPDFAGIAEANSASLTTMAPGVAAALVATVTGLLVAIPAMFAYNFMVTTVRAITQELDGFATRYATQIEHVYVDNRPLAEEIKSANEALAGRIVEGLKADESRFQNTPAI